MKRIRKILVANRGEIAARIIRTIHKMQLQSVAIYAHDDRSSLHAAMAGEAYMLAGTSLDETYLNKEQIIAFALASGCQAIHPGYGFLSENESFAQACEQNGLIFIGPGPETIRLMGDKIAAREFALTCNIPVPKGLYIRDGILPTANELERIQFPVLVKPSGGGGGKGMRIVHSPETLAGEILAASREAMNYFGNREVYLEEYIMNGKHIEVQVLGDGTGKIVHLFERECSVQRRFQKMIEEAPSPSLSEPEREELIRMAVKLAEAAKYRSAGTIEFLMDTHHHFRFLEMNTRIQVEHPVTEMITGIDLVEEQIRIAETGLLRLDQDKISMHGHAIEARIYAEDPMKDFSPSPGRILFYREPQQTGIRIDPVASGSFMVSPQYDPMISKLIVHAPSRNESLDRLGKALGEYTIFGIHTNISYLQELIRHPEIIDASYTTDFIGDSYSSLIDKVRLARIPIPFMVAAAAWYILQSSRPSCIEYAERDIPVWQSIGYWRLINHFQIRMDEDLISFFTEKRNKFLFITLNDEIHSLEIISIDKEQSLLRYKDTRITLCHAWENENKLLLELNGTVSVLIDNTQVILQKSGASSKSSEKNGQEMIHAPMHGKIIKVNVEPNQPVSKGEVLMILEAMKMENNILAPADGTMDRILVHSGSQVEKDCILAKINV